MRREDLISVLDTSKQWREDSFGNYKKIEPETIGKHLDGTPFLCFVRLKLNKNAVRFEYKDAGMADWRNLRSDYYSNCRMEGKNLIIGGRKIDIS